MKLLIVALLACAGSCLVTGADGNAKLEKVDQLCRQKLASIRTVSAMRQFVDDLLELDQSVDNLKSMPSHVTRCLNEIDSIRDLQNLVSPDFQRFDVCYPSYIDMIVAYHDIHIKPYKKGKSTSASSSSVKSVLSSFMKKVTSIDHHSNSNNRKRLIEPFFAAFATQVSFVCKQRIVYNIEQVAHPKFDEQDYQKVVPWYSLQTHDELESLMDHMEKIEDLQLSNYHRPKSRNERRKTPPDASVFTSPTTREKIEQIKGACPRFKRYYDGAILSVVRLAKLGYSMGTPSTEKMQRESSVLKLWLTIVQICDTMEKINLIDAEEDDNNNAGNYEASGKIMRVVLNTRERRQQLQSDSLYVDDEATHDSLQRHDPLGADQESTELELRPFRYDSNKLGDVLFTDKVTFERRIPIIGAFLAKMRMKIGQFLRKQLAARVVKIESNDDADDQEEFARQLIESFEDTYQNSLGDTMSQSSGEDSDNGDNDDKASPTAKVLRNRNKSKTKVGRRGGKGYSFYCGRALCAFLAFFMIGVGIVLFGFLAKG